MLFPLWEEWALMNRLHCTAQQLRAMEAGDLALFRAFVRGEAEGAKQKSDEHSLSRGKR